MVADPFRVAPGIARFDVEHTWDGLHALFGTPETAHPEDDRVHLGNGLQGRGKNQAGQ